MATRIAAYRKRRGMTQTQLAEHLGIHPTSLSKIERGHRYLTERMERRIAQVLGLTPDETRDMLGFPQSARQVPHLRVVARQ